MLELVDPIELGVINPYDDKGRAMEDPYFSGVMEVVQRNGFPWELPTRAEVQSFAALRPNARFQTFLVDGGVIPPNSLVWYLCRHPSYEDHDTAESGSFRVGPIHWLLRRRDGA